MTALVSTTPNSAQTQEAALAVNGMDCASCVAHVEKTARAITGVQACQVNLARGRAVLRIDPALTSAQGVAEAIGKAGYPSSVESAEGSAAEAEERRHDAQREHAKSWLRRAIVAGALWLPVETTHWIHQLTAHHIESGKPTWMTWLSLVTSTITLLYVGAAFYRSALAALRQRTSNMDTLISMGASVAYVYSMVALIGYFAGHWALPADLYFMEAAGLLALISFGHWLEARARDRAGSAIRELLNLTPATALLMSPDGAEPTTVPAHQLSKNDRILVRPGDRIAADGVVVSGQSDVDESMITGESIPVPRAKGDAVIGGTINQSGSLVVRLTKVGSQTALAQIVKMVETAQSAKPPVQRLADRISAVFVPSVLCVALLTGIGWYAWGAWHGWMPGQTWGHVARSVCSVLIIACPCALGLAVPATLMVGIGRGAKRGILIRDIDALQVAEMLDTIVLDKTGTLTQGKPQVAAVTAEPGLTEADVLRLAAAAEQFSEHPLAKAVVRYAQELHVEFPDPESFANDPGYGITATIEGRRILAGNAALLVKHGASADTLRAPTGQTLIYVAQIKDARPALLGTIALADALKPDSIQAVRQLHEMGLRTVLLTGDNASTASQIAAQVGIKDVRADVKPDQKAQVIAQLQGLGGKTHRVAMVGDGVNDAPALALADLGIAIGSGSDIAKETGDIVLVSGSLHGIVTSIRLSRATMSKIRQNLFWAFAYNVLAIPLAALGLLNPLIAAGAMALSDVTVLGNALLLRRKRID